MEIYQFSGNEEVKSRKQPPQIPPLKLGQVLDDNEHFRVREKKDKKTKKSNLSIKDYHHPPNVTNHIDIICSPEFMQTKSNRSNNSSSNQSQSVLSLEDDGMSTSRIIERYEKVISSDQSEMNP